MVESIPSTDTGQGGQGQDLLVPEDITPFNEETCSSSSLTVKRLTPTSKFVDYQPTANYYSAKEIKEQCKKFGLFPAEIRTREDWDSVEKSGIGGVISDGDKDVPGGSSKSYFYVLGMDDSEEAGKIRYNSDGSPLTFSMFSTDGSTKSVNKFN